MNKYTACSFSFVKIITSIYTDCDYLNNKLYFVVMFFSFQQFKYLSNELELEQFYSSSSSSSEKIFFRVQVQVRVLSSSSSSSSSSSQPWTIITRHFRVMLTVLIDQIEHLDNFSMRSYYVRQLYGTNEIIQFSERKLIDINRCEWSFNAIAPTNSILRQYDAVGHILLFYLFRLQSYIF